MSFDRSPSSCVSLESLESLATVNQLAVEERLETNVETFGQPWSADAEAYLLQSDYPDLLAQEMVLRKVSHRTLPEVKPVVFGAIATAVEVSAAIVHPEPWGMDISAYTQLEDPKQIKHHILTHGIDYILSRPSLKKLASQALSRLTADRTLGLSALHVMSLTFAQVEAHRQSLQSVLLDAETMSMMSGEEWTTAELDDYQL